MAYILALETSSTICSVALFKGDYLLGISELQIEKSHSSHITVLIDQLLQNCRVAASDLGAIALSAGPGSYTGLRIGSSTAKGLCYALDIPLLSVSTLHAIALEAITFTPNPVSTLFCPMIDARRMEVYACLVNDQLEEIIPTAPVILQTDSFQDHLALNTIIFVGNGSTKFRDLIGTNRNVLFLEEIKPSAKNLGELAWQKYQKNEFENVAYYEPFYLKEVYITTSKS